MASAPRGGGVRLSGHPARHRHATALPRGVALALTLLAALPSPVAAQADPAPPPAAAPRVTVTPETLRADSRAGVWRVDIAPHPGAAERPVLGAEATGDGVRLLRHWWAEGRAAGLAGVFYDNRDGGHSRLSRTDFPQLTHIDYGPELVQQGLDRALAGRFLFRAPVLGNASMAVTGGNAPRSLPRLAMTDPGAPMAAFLGHVHNHLHVYPAHHDYREADLFPASLPYLVVSRGSSGSDQPVLRALALAMAALRPDTRARLEAEGLLASTLVMLLRRGVAGPLGYLTPAGHPAVIERAQLRPATMMQLAQTITPDTIPPLVRLEVQGEGFAPAAGLSGESERLFDTPSAVARLWRGWDAQRQMTLSAARTADPNGRPLEFRWVLVSGDPARVRIEPLDAAQSRARLTIDWHDAPVPVAPGGLPSARVEIAVIAWNGAQYSAPALVSVAFPAHERRLYAPGPDGRPRLQAVDYDAEARGAAHDPVLWWSAPWRDLAVHDDAGRLIAWRRQFRDGSSALLTPAAPGSHRLVDGERRRELQWSPPPR